jgi:hypothetical protein
MDRRAHDAARGHAVVATLGQRALAGTDFPLLLDQTVSLVADAMKVAAVAVCEVAEDGRLLVRASHGLNAAVSRHQRSTVKHRLPIRRMARRWLATRSLRRKASFIPLPCASPAAHVHSDC